MSENLWHSGKLKYSQGGEWFSSIFDLEGDKLMSNSLKNRKANKKKQQQITIQITPFITITRVENVNNQPFCYTLTDDNGVVLLTFSCVRRSKVKFWLEAFQKSKFHYVTTNLIPETPNILNNQCQEKNSQCLLSVNVLIKIQKQKQSLINKLVMQKNLRIEKDCVLICNSSKPNARVIENMHLTKDTKIAELNSFVGGLKLKNNSQCLIVLVNNVESKKRITEEMQKIISQKVQLESTRNNSSHIYFSGLGNQSDHYFENNEEKKFQKITKSNKQKELNLKEMNKKSDNDGDGDGDGEDEENEFGTFVVSNNAPSSDDENNDQLSSKKNKGYLRFLPQKKTKNNYINIDDYFNSKKSQKKKNSKTDKEKKNEDDGKEGSIFGIVSESESESESDSNEDEKAKPQKQQKYFAEQYLQPNNDNLLFGKNFEEAEDESNSKLSYIQILSSKKKVLQPNERQDSERLFGNNVLNSENEYLREETKEKDKFIQNLVKQKINSDNELMNALEEISNFENFDNINLDEIYQIQNTNSQLQRKLHTLEYKHQFLINNYNEMLKIGENNENMDKVRTEFPPQKLNEDLSSEISPLQENSNLVMDEVYETCLQEVKKLEGVVELLDETIKYKEESKKNEIEYLKSQLRIQDSTILQSTLKKEKIHSKVKEINK
ncbi:hypothetical protein M0812_17620 [Anaeramoeba flamelloides]|uniref:PH domain-containing protein n=1 Tax=Anaeramoeba flamelloides TaxID=1746091 RepID=A0AAV7Z9Q4_9EUKA|nr:hypothetical protein M0812_17620 [Anaeramoeba flamelloides]